MSQWAFETRQLLAPLLIHSRGEKEITFLLFSSYPSVYKYTWVCSGFIYPCNSAFALSRTAIANKNILTMLTWGLASPADSGNTVAVIYPSHWNIQDKSFPLPLSIRFHKNNHHFTPRQNKYRFQNLNTISGNKSLFPAQNSWSISH